MRVLIVSEDAAFRNTIALALEESGYEISQASSATEAAGILHRSAHPLVALLDEQGMEVLSAVASDRRLIRYHAYVLMCSDAVSLGPESQRLLALLRALVLRKPFDKEKLLEIVAQASRDLVAAS